MSTLITAGNGMGIMHNATHELPTNAAELNPDPNRIPNPKAFGIYIPQFTRGIPHFTRTQLGLLLCLRRLSHVSSV